MLGIMFGYLFYWTGSLWVPVFAHFLNNGSAVIISFFVTRGQIDNRYEDFGSTNNVFIIMASVIITLALFYWILRKTNRQQNGSEELFLHGQHTDEE